MAHADSIVVAEVVKPSASDERDGDKQQCTRIQRLVATFGRATDTWHGLLISWRGMYSLERMHALKEYQATASCVRILLVYLTTPLLPLLFIIGLESIPLKPPDAGWRANDTTWVRLWVFGVVTTHGLLVQAREMVPQLPLNAKQAFVVSLATSTGYLVCYVLVSSLWCFPIPFGTVLGVFPFTTCLFLVLAVVIGPRKLLRDTHGLRVHLKLYGKVVVIQCSLAILYPLYNAIFTQLSPTQQTCFLVVLPIMRLAMKNVVATVCAEVEDLVPELALFSIELFNALYTVTCMQNAGSTVTTCLIIAFDVFNSMLSLHGIYQQTSVVKELQGLRVNVDRSCLLAMVGEICHDRDMLKHGHLGKVRLRTVLQYTVLRSNSDLYRKITQAVQIVKPNSPTAVVPLGVARRVKTMSRLASKPRAIRPLVAGPSLQSLKSAKRLLTVLSAPMPRPSAVPWMRASDLSAASNATTTRTSFTKTDDEPKAKSVDTLSTLTAEQKAKLVEQTLHMLFHCEYLVLAEYIECVMPIVYATYLLALYHLPNAQYFDHMRSMTHEKLYATISTVLIYASLEFATLVLLHLVLYRRLGISLLHQLAFVLETQRGMIQGKMVIWVPFILQFTLVHCGVDFTFKFDFKSPPPAT